MCKDIVSSIKKTTSMAAFTTTKLHTLLSKWLKSKEKEVLNTLAKSGNDNLAHLYGVARIVTPYRCARI